MALGFIAFAIGHEFRLSALKQTGKQATIIGILQAVVATACVDSALVTFHFLRPDLLSFPENGAVPEALPVFITKWAP